MYGDKDYFHPDRFREAMREEWPGFPLKDSKNKALDEEFVQRFGQALLEFNFHATRQETLREHERLDRLVDKSLPLSFFSTADGTERVAILAESTLIPPGTMAVIHNKVVDDSAKEHKKIMYSAVWIIDPHTVGYHSNILAPDKTGGWTRPHNAPLIEVRGDALEFVADTTMLDRDHAEFIFYSEGVRDDATEGAVDALIDLRDALRFCTENTHVPWVTHYA